MKIKFLKHLALAISLTLFASCASTKNVYRSPGIKIEAENFTLSETSAQKDESASGSMCVPLEKESSLLQTTVTLDEGTYECLLKIKAGDTDHSFLTLTVDETPYRIYTSNPPIGFWELSTRTPVYINVDEKKTITIKIRADRENKSYDKNLMVDYIQIVKVYLPS